MEKSTFFKQEDFNKWFDACAKDHYMDGKMPNKFPCVATWVEVSERNSFKDSIYFGCVYINDFIDNNIIIN